MKNLQDKMISIKQKLLNLLSLINKKYPFSIQKLQIVLLFITLFVITYMLAIPFLGQKEIDLSKESSFSEGKKSPKRIISSKEIIYIDEETFETLKKKAKQSVPLVFEKNYSILEEKIVPNVKKTIEHLKKYQTSKYYIFRKTLSDYPSLQKSDVKNNEILRKSKSIESFENIVLQYINVVFSTFCISSIQDLSKEDLETLKVNGAVIKNIGIQESESLISYNEFLTETSFIQDPKTHERIKEIIITKIDVQKITPQELEALIQFSNYYLLSNIKCNYIKEETEEKRKSAVAMVQPPKVKITSGEVIVEKDQVITKKIYKRLTVVNKYATRANISSITSIFLIQIFFAFLIIVFLRNNNPTHLKYVSGNLILFSIIWLILLTTYFASIVFYNPQQSHNYESTYYLALFVPIGLLGLFLGYIYDEKFAITIGFYLSFYIFAASRYNPTSFTLAISTSILSAYFGSRLSKRIDFLVAGLCLGLVQVFISLTGYLFESRNYWIERSTGSFLTDLLQSQISKIALVCLINGFFCSIASQFLLPIYENLFNLSTRFKLFELADTSHPLIQELLTKAPATYTHTFLVSALSENAARKLGLNWLLTKVGVFFHDVGKLKNPHFFIENQQASGEKEKREQDPLKGAQMVIAHVQNGLEMARKAKLPREVINFIPEHHGTTVMNFFYHQALKEAPENEKSKIQKKDFQYPGPKPQTKETGIVMIADSVEAASRSLEEVNSKSLDGLIQKIINNKLTEGQLDECGLTVGELSMIKESFKKVLLSSLHARPQYPKMEDTKKLEQGI